jgi:hypothetical protein
VNEHWRKPNTAALLDVAIHMRNDTTLNAAAASPYMSAGIDTTMANRTLVAARTASGAPLAAIAADSAGNPVVISFAAPGTLAAAAIIAAALDAVRDRTALESNPDVIAPEIMNRWQNRPAASRDQRTIDRNTTDSDGRWLWLIALLMIGLETYLSRTTRVADSTRDETAHDRAA